MKVDQTRKFEGSHFQVVGRDLKWTFTIIGVRLR